MLLFIVFLSLLAVFLNNPLFTQSRNLNDESKTHIHLLNKVESDMTAESVALRAGNFLGPHLTSLNVYIPSSLIIYLRLSFLFHVLKHFTEAMRAETIRKGQSGVCWMYGIICMELVLLVFLLYIGISNQ